MLIRSLSFVVAAGLVVTVAGTQFQGAPAGTAVAFTRVELPEVTLRPAGALSHAPISAGSFSPSLDQVVNGSLVIQNDEQMRAVWEAVFNRSYDPTLFDFTNNVVLWMGGGPQTTGSFWIHAVEQVDAAYEHSGWFAGGDTEIDPFLSVTGVTYVSPYQPASMIIIPATLRVSAVQVSRSDFHSVLFHRRATTLPLVLND